MLVIDSLGPIFVQALDLVNSDLVIVGVVIHPGEMIEVPFHLGMLGIILSICDRNEDAGCDRYLIVAAGKREFCPALLGD